MNGSTPGQLILPVGLRDDATFENYFPHAASAPALEAIRTQLATDGEQIVFLHGPDGVGKTHLLQAAAQADGEASLYLPLDQLAEYAPDAVLQQAEHSRRICIDDLQAVVGNPAWEAALFNVFNAARSAGAALLVAADAPPRGLALQLEDLRSRLSWGVVYALAEANDEDKAQILALRGRARSMTLSPSVAAYIVSRAPRGTAQLLVLLDRLAEASLVRKRPISIPFVKEVFRW